MAGDLPLLPTTGVGSYALPSWLYASDDWIQRGLFGPTDIAERDDDAVDMALRDQERAGLDIVTDGEMRRRGFSGGFLSRVAGLERVGARRRTGEPGRDQEPYYQTTGAVQVPEGLGIVAEFAYLQTRTTRPTKVTVPGPFALTSWIEPVAHYRDRTHLAEAFVPAVNAELRALAAAGATFIQIDEPATPGLGSDRHTPHDIARLFNASVAGVSGVRFALHICFGTYKRLSYAARTYAPYFPAILEARVDQLVLEYANREMAEIAEWPRWAPDRELGAGVVDVRTDYLDSVEEIAARIRQCLQHVPADKLYLNPDCGLRRTPRWLARRKLENLVAAARLVRGELAGRA